MSDSSSSTPLTLRLGHEELQIRRRYEVLSIINDILIAIWFTLGSALFFWESTTTLGTWFFVIGSMELGIRPAIRLGRHMHLYKLQSSRVGQTTRNGRESDQDF